MPPQRHLPTSTRLKVRQRSQRACVPCRKRKIKCDAAEPCAACSGYGYDCSYADPPTHPGRSSTVVPPPSQHVAGSHDAVEVTDPVAAALPLTKKPDVPYMTTEAVVTDMTGAPRLLQAIKTRFTSAYSAVAWPRRLGNKLGMQCPPRLQAYGWNPGTRPEVNREPQNSICNIVSHDEAKRFANIYFKEVHPYFGILDQEMFNERCEDFWIGVRRGTDFEACICGVVALGSYFSCATSSAPAPPSPAEAQVVEQGRLLLDLSVAFPPAMISVKHVVAWILRTLYLRLTTRPHIAWLASCTAVHMAEAVGLHRDISEFQMKPGMPRQITETEINFRRRTFWVAISLNQFFASEYGRTKVHIDLVSCEPLGSRAGDITAQTVTILQSASGQDSLGRPAELLEALTKAMALPVKSAFLGIIRTDVCFCIYRMMCSTNSRLPSELLPSVLDIIRIGLDGVTFLTIMNQPWWNVVSMPLQTVAVLLSIGTAESLKMVSSTLELLKKTAEAYDSHLSREALATAYALVEAARDMKSRELDSLDRGLDVVGDASQSNGSSNTSPRDELQWPIINDLGFSDFLDLSSYYGISDQPL